MQFSTIDRKLVALPATVQALRTAKPAGVRGALSVDPGEFCDKFNRSSFLFHHAFAGSSLFTLPRLAMVAERLLARGDHGNVVCRGGKSSFADAKFSAMPLRHQLAETVRRIEDENVWLKLTSVNTADREYDELLKSILREIEQLSGESLLPKITWSSMTLFVASPRVLTPYHIDHESNFLFQVSGAKNITLFDPSDRDVVPDEQVERFYAGDFEAAQYRPDLAGRGTVYRLVPGAVVHHPPLAPHWVQNGEEVSISVSIGFCLRPYDRLARVHQVNHFLRRFGFTPTPPGVSSLRDGLKIGAVGMLSKSNPTTPQDILFSGLSRLRSLRLM